jgi:hypothetical protein
MLSNCMLGLAQPQLQKWARCSTAVFPKIFMFKEKLSQVSPIPEDYSVTPPPLRIASPPCVAAVYNKLPGGGGGWCVSIRAHSLPGPSFMHVWSSVFFCSGISCRPQLGFSDNLAWLTKGHQLIPCSPFRKGSEGCKMVTAPVRS